MLRERERKNELHRRLAHGAADEEDLLEGMKRGLIHSREQARRAWGLD